MFKTVSLKINPELTDRFGWFEKIKSMQEELRPCI